MWKRINALIRYLSRLFRKKDDRDRSLNIPVQAQKSGDELKVLTCLEGKSNNDPLTAAIRPDQEEKSSVVEPVKCYTEELQGELDNSAPTFAKLAKLFECGLTLDISRPESALAHRGLRRPARSRPKE